MRYSGFCVIPEALKGHKGWKPVVLRHRLLVIYRWVPIRKAKALKLDLSTVVQRNKACP